MTRECTPPDTLLSSSRESGQGVSALAYQQISDERLLHCLLAAGALLQLSGGRALIKSYDFPIETGWVHAVLASHDSVEVLLWTCWALCGEGVAEEG